MFVNYMLFVDAMSIQPPSCSGVFLLPGQVEIAAFFRWGNHSSVGAKMDTQTHDRQAWSLYDWLTPSGGISLLKESNRGLAREADISITHWFPPHTISNEK